MTPVTDAIFWSPGVPEQTLFASDGPPKAPAAFAGWHRPAGHLAFTKLTEGRSASDCWRTLLETIAELPGPGGDSVVLPINESPNHRRRPR